MLATTIDVPAWAALITSLLTITAMIAAAVAIARQQAIRASLATIIEANEELRKANADLRSEVVVEREKRAVLEGRLDALTSDLAMQIVSAVARAISEKEK